MRDTARKVLGVSSKQRKEDKETWWWGEELQESIRKKRFAKKRWDIQRDEESKPEYKEMRREMKKEVAKAKSKPYDELYEGLDTTEGENTLYRLARQTPSGKGRTTGKNGEGSRWKRNDRRGERIENMIGILHGADE